MSFRIIYTTKIEQREEPVGKISFFDKYQPSNPFFPYFYLGEKSEIINYSNWPDLVPYLYNKTLGFFTTISSIYQYKNTFSIYSLKTENNIITLNFQDVSSIIALKALNEDRKLYFLENNNYDNWNKTFTPIEDIVINNNIYFLKNINYYINNINIVNETNGSITVIKPNSVNVGVTILNSKNIEFGIHRIPGKTAFESIIYHGLKGKTFATSESSDLISGLVTRSQIMGHSHDHIHNLNNHTHTMPHTHDLSNHVHYMNHQHGYNDIRNGDNKGLNPWANGGWNNVNLSSGNYDVSRSTYNANMVDTNGPNVNTSGSASQSTTTEASNVNTSNIKQKTVDKDDINSNNDNLKIGNKTFSETYCVYAYIYGIRYLPSI